MTAQDLPLPSVHVHKNGTYTHTYYKINADNQVVQVKRTLKIGRDLEQSKRAIEERRNNWTKFGLNYLKEDPTFQPTRLDTEFPLKLAMHPDELDAPETMVQTAQRALKDSTIKCRFCGGPHWSKECPSKDIIQSLQEATQGVSDDGPSSSASGLGAGSAGAGGSRYVPPSVRAAMAAGGSASDADAAGGRMMPRRMDDSFPVRIANLPEEMSDQDLVDLVQAFGRISRSYLAKHDDGTCKGFAFVNFSSYTEAEAAVSRLNGYGYANLILTCEHSKPRPPK